ncbi:hypothetical protein JKP76_06370 [Blastococcus sp. TML/C7B]|uniref:hypothetical protein n=1 Tax=Blastococcus sp. TML/C7B TaxID=2798728 RepID=UPI00190AF763|nr:hypothetical protein [Blastococcus sp. TML/C7B]MBN1095690.1 hypothetical protein [Blastococcus sp. TML/C7B]
MTAVLGVAAVVSVALPLSVAGAAGGAIVNGDFETGAPGDTVVTGWSFADQVVDLGVTSLGGCVSKDTSTYTTLRGYDDVEPVLGTVPVGGDGEVFLPGTSTPVWLDENGLLADAGAPGALQLHYGPVEFSEDGDTWTYTDFFVLIEGAPVLVGDVGSSVGDGNFSNGFYDSVHPLYLSVPDPTERADDVPGADFFNYTEFSSQLVAPGAEEDEDIEGIAWGMDGSDLTPTSQALLLSSDMDGSAYGYVAHGPAAVSDPFTTAGARTVSLDWAAAAESDDYHVLGYVLDVNTCEQVEVLDATGYESPWQTVSVQLPRAGTYRFVFVAGTYDQSWGGAAGARLYVDNIRATPTITGTGIQVEPLFGTGDTVASAPVQLTGGGLKPNSPWIAELHSTPVTLATGVTDSSGNFWLLSNLPASVEPGKHRIILSGTAPDGSAVSSTAWITVTAAGTVGYVSLAGEEIPVAPTAPAGAAAQPVAATGTGPALANTGFEAAPWLGVGAALVAAGGAVLLGVRRRTAQR